MCACAAISQAYLIYSSHFDLLIDSLVIALGYIYIYYLALDSYIYVDAISLGGTK